jgi:hypothetical protein
MRKPNIKSSTKPEANAAKEPEHELPLPELTYMEQIRSSIYRARTAVHAAEADYRIADDDLSTNEVVEIMRDLKSLARTVAQMAAYVGI